MKFKNILSILLVILIIFTMCPISYGSNISFKDCWGTEQVITLSYELENRPYIAIFLFNQSNFNMIYYVCCDSEFIVHINKSNKNYKSIRVNGYSNNVTGYSGSQFNLAYKGSSTLSNSSSVTSFCNSLSSMSFSDLSIPTHAVINADAINNGSCIYSNFDLKTSDGDIYNKAFSDFSIDLSTTENTNNPITAYSNYFNYDDASKYKCYISTNAKDWDLMNYETFNNTETGSVQFRFNYKIFENGTYYFKLFNTETNKEKYITYIVTNILKNSSNSGINDLGIPQPFCTYERVGDEFIIKTQNFDLEDMQKYKCLYTNDSSNLDYSTWSEMNMGTINNIKLNTTEYYFYFTVPTDSENCMYYFVFYDYKQNAYGYPSSLTCDFDYMNEYCDKIQGVLDEEKNRFQELLNFFKERFGFLTYPFEFIADLFNRILNIDYGEPIIRIPKLYIPGSEQKIFDGYEYNFNNVLENNVISNIYNIYLVAVDFILVIGVVVLSYDTIMEVFGNG